jgi:hypothetical protein
MPLITSRHWLTFAVESLKKLYNRTCAALKTYDIPYQTELTSLNSRPLLSYNVLELVLYRWNCMLRRSSQDHAPLSQFLLQSPPGIVVTNEYAWVQSCEKTSRRGKTHAFTLICSELNRHPSAITEERFLKIILFMQISVGGYNQRDIRGEITFPWLEKKIGRNPSTDARSGCNVSIECGQCNVISSITERAQFTIPL